MFLPRVWLLLQTLSCTTSFAVTSDYPSSSSSIGNNNNPIYRSRHRAENENQYYPPMSRAFDQPQQHHHHHHGPPPLLSSSSSSSSSFRKQQRQYPPSYQHPSHDYRRQHQPASSSSSRPRRGSNSNNSSGRRRQPLPLAMIPDSNTRYHNYRLANTYLDATERGRGGGGQEERDGGRGGRRDGEAISAPAATKSSSSTASDGGSSSSSIARQISTSITEKLNSMTRTLTSSKKARGRAILLLVSFLYGTLNVTLRAVYATDGPPAASVLSLVRQLLSIATFVPLFAMSSSSKLNNTEERQEEEEKEEGLKMIVDDNGETTAVEKVRPMWLSALELAFWNFGAQGFINAGLLFSPAARASFLTQTSVVMTPLISALAGESIKSTVWGGCGLALLGLFLISTSGNTVELDGGGDALDAAASAVAASSSITTLNQGDVMILLGALSWSTYIFRTSKLAKSYPELGLQFSKTVLLAFMYMGWFLFTAASTLAAAGTSFLSPGWVDALTPLWSGWASPVVWLILAYSAVGPGAVADLLQQQGQRETSASESNIILCMESVFAAVCAFALLGEVSSMKEMAGGLLIVVAAILASKE